MENSLSPFRNFVAMVDNEKVGYPWKVPEPKDPYVAWTGHLDRSYFKFTIIIHIDVLTLDSYLSPWWA